MCSYQRFAVIYLLAIISCPDTTPPHRNKGPYDFDLKKSVDFGLKNSVYLDLNSFTVSNFDLKPKLCQQCT